MNWALVSLEHAAAQPWRNGGGLTRELLAWPSASQWRVRMSVAEVQAAGPFSRFEGVERWFAVMDGEGVKLRLDHQAPHTLTRESEPFQFDGGMAVDCTLLGGPTRDFNLMAPPAAARMERVRGEREIATSGGLIAVYAHGDRATIIMEGAAFTVPAFQLAWMQRAAAANVRVRADDALWMEVRT